MHHTPPKAVIALHGALVALHTRLVEWIDLEHVAVDCNNVLIEVDQTAQIPLIEPLYCDLYDRHTPLLVRFNGAIQRLPVDLVKCISVKIIQAVQVQAVSTDSQSRVSFSDNKQSFDEVPPPLLNYLPDTV